MRIAIDGSAIPRQMAGAGVYTYQLARALAGLETEHEFVVFARRDLFNDLPNLEVIDIEPRHPAVRLAWEQVVLPFLLRRHQVDLIHSTHHHTPAIVGPGVSRVVTFNDVTFLLLPERYPRLRRSYMEAVTRVAARVADAIITPSAAVRTDVVTKLSPGSDVTVVPDAAGPQYGPAAESEVNRVRELYDIQGPYVISVSSLEPGKNRTRLIQAFERVRTKHPNLLLIIVGQPAWDYVGDQDLVRRLGLEQAVRFTGYVPDEDLPPLYSGAVLLAYPSLYEGFGLPILEAMACGTPVITSDLGATAEVASDAALLVDPLDIERIAAAIERLLSDEQLRDDLRSKGRARASEFSWERTARETLAVYEQSLPPN